MPELAYDAQVDALDAILGRVVEVGLARLDPDDEEDDANYQRRPISFGAPRRDAEGRVVRMNAGIVRFPAYALSGAAPVSWSTSVAALKKHRSSSGRGLHRTWPDSAALVSPQRPGSKSAQARACRCGAAAKSLSRQALQRRSLSHARSQRMR